MNFGAKLMLQKVRACQNLELVWRFRRRPPPASAFCTSCGQGPVLLATGMSCQCASNLIVCPRYYKQGNKVELAPTRPVCCLRASVSLQAGELARLF